MDDQLLKDIFNSYDPTLTSGTKFVGRLEHKLDLIEDLRKHNAVLRKRCHRAMAAAAIAGFVVGVIFTLAMPYIFRALQDIRAYMPDISILNTISGHGQYIIWPIICATSLFIAVNTYEISLAIQSRHSQDR